MLLIENNPFAGLRLRKENQLIKAQKLLDEEKGVIFSGFTFEKNLSILNFSSKIIYNITYNLVQRHVNFVGFLLSSPD